MKQIPLKLCHFGFSINFKVKVEDYNKKIKKGNILAIKKIVIALAGPLTNILIIIFGLINKLNINIIYSNVLLVVFNLIPIYPLDGGRIIKNIVRIYSGTRKSNQYTYIISNVFIIILTMISSILLLVYKNISIFIIMVFLWYILIKENMRYNTYNKIYKTIDKNYNYL